MSLVLEGGHGSGEARGPFQYSCADVVHKGVGTPATEDHDLDDRDIREEEGHGGFDIDSHDGECCGSARVGVCIIRGIPKGITAGFCWGRTDGGGGVLAFG